MCQTLQSPSQLRRMFGGEGEDFLRVCDKAWRCVHQKFRWKYSKLEQNPFYSNPTGIVVLEHIHITHQKDVLFTEAMLPIITALGRGKKLTPKNALEYASLSIKLQMDSVIPFFPCVILMYWIILREPGLSIR